MDNDKSNINKELDHIKNSINEKSEPLSDDADFILLDKIISRTKKYDDRNKNDLEKKDTEEKSKIIKADKKLKNSKKSIINKISNPEKKPKDPVAALVDREIKPIIKKWIGKNLKKFVKAIVIEEMKLISKATQKHK